MALPIAALFVCAKCRARFAPAGGGLCGACRRVFCRRHLQTADRGAGTRFVCTDCGGRDAGVGAPIIERIRVHWRRLMARRRA